AIENAGHTELAEPAQLPARIELGDGRIEGHRRRARQLDTNNQSLTDSKPAARRHDGGPLGPPGRIQKDLPHRRRRGTDRAFGVDGPHAARSSATAVASPPPMHRAAMPLVWPYFCMACRSVMRMRAPEAPIGWPSAQAPPCTFILSCGMPMSRMAAM